jgi:outer membrane immunogenic protein
LASPSAMEQGAMRRSLVIMLAILSFLGSAKAKADDIAYAYCPLGEGYVFLYDTVDGFQVLADLECGEKLTVVDTQDKERTKVRTAAGKQGYVFKYTITPVLGVPPESVALPDVSIKPSRPAQEAHPEAPPQVQPPSEPQPAQVRRPAQPLAESRRTQSVLRRPQKFEVFGGYSYMRSNVVLTGAPLTLNGGSASMAMYFNDWLGIAGDFGLYRQNNVAGQGFNLVFSTYQFGPRLRFSNATRATPFVHFLWGAGHAGGTLYTRSLGYGVPPLGANYTFVLTAGGGADWRVSSRISIRMIEAEYIHSEFLNFSGNRQENIRLSTGVVFNFGGE